MSLPEVRDAVSWPPLWTSLWEMSFTTTITGLSAYARTGIVAKLTLSDGSVYPALDTPAFEVYRAGLGDPWLWRVADLKHYNPYPSYEDVTAGAAGGTQVHRVTIRVYSEQDAEPDISAYVDRRYALTWVIDNVTELDIWWEFGAHVYMNNWGIPTEPSQGIEFYTRGDFNDPEDHIVEGLRTWVDVDCPEPVTLVVADVVSSVNGIIRYADDLRDGLVEGCIDPSRDTSRKGVKIGGYEDADGLHLTIPQAEVWGRYENSGVDWAPVYHDTDWNTNGLATTTFYGTPWRQPYSGIRHGIGGHVRSGTYYVPYLDNGSVEVDDCCYRRYQEWDDPSEYQFFGVEYAGENMLTPDTANGTEVEYTNVGDILVKQDGSTVSYDHDGTSGYAEFYDLIPGGFGNSSALRTQLDRFEDLPGIFSWAGDYGSGPGRVLAALQTGYLYTTGYVTGSDNGVTTHRHHTRVVSQVTLAAVSVSTQPDTEEYIRTECAAVAFDRITQQAVMVGLQDQWTGSREADGVTVAIVRQTHADTLAAEETIVDLPALSGDQAGYLLADAALDDAGRLWVAVWRLEHDFGDVSLLVYRQSDERSEASLLNTTTGLSRPPRWVGQLVIDNVSGEVLFCYGQRDGEDMKLVALQVDIDTPVSNTIDMPALTMPEPGYGGWYGERVDGTRPWEDASWLNQRALLDVGIWPTGRWRATTDLRGFWDWQTTIPVTPLADYAEIHEAPGYDRAGEYQTDDWTYSYAQDAQVIHDLIEVAAAVDPLCAAGEFAELSWRDW